MARILVVDDEAQIRLLVQEMLKREGHEVMEASDGKQGSQLYREHRPDLVILDLIMPDQEGLETIRELKQDFPEVKIIAMSGGGHGGAEDYLRLAKAFGARETLVKPFSLEEMVGAVREVLR